MTSNRPYLVRAIHEWIIDNDMTPFILVNAETEGVEVPAQYIEDARIVLNISPLSVKDLQINNENISFNARFAGTPFQIWIPIHGVIAIYAKENGMGLVFQEEEQDQTKDSTTSATKPHLKVIK